MLEYILAALLGVAAGGFTGLVPGIHANTVVFVTLPLYLGSGVDLMVYMSFVSAVSVSHTFHDFLPAIFLGLAEAESALATLPGPAMASKGRGLEAFALTVSGGLVSVSGFILALPFLYMGLEMVYAAVSELMLPILLFFAVYVIFKTDDIASSATVGAMAGLLGLLSFNAPVNQTYVLMPVFGGLFSAPAVLRGFGEEVVVPPQEGNVSYSRDFFGSLCGFVAGLVAGLVPGVGGATSTSFLMPLLEKRERFLTAMGAVNTSDIFVSFIALVLIGKSRSGASVALSYLSRFGAPEAVFLIGVSVLAASISAPVAFAASDSFLSLVERFSVSQMYIASGAVLLLTTVWLTGLVGVLVLLTSSCIGFAAAETNQRKSCMLVLMVPALRFYTTGLIL